MGTVAEGYPYVWRLKTTLQERKGEACRVEHLSATKVRVEFRDRLRVTAHRSAVTTGGAGPKRGCV